MTIHSASFVTSSTSAEDCPKTEIPEYAFIGRSNVGKSTLINYLTGHNKLAKTSGIPGKTQLINHFLINDDWHLVDLPGYGYAKTSKKNKRQFRKMITDYFSKRKQLISAFILIDSRHPVQKADLDFMLWMGENQVPFTIIFTKTDKLKPAVLERNLEAYRNELNRYWDPLPQQFITSSVKQQGKEPILTYIDTLNKSL